ncbi:DNA ligase [Phytomonospora sp. NPDC050363]|uniref:ATP-dependent DNA ligase n=1 Tax=Phytomonospora sp. NPDC050363 TaxID=3155642 RepID=UPI0033CD5779
MAATRGRLPSGPDWVFEPKWDGCRLLASASATEGVHAWTRSGREVTGMLPELDGLTDVVGDALLDGELVVLGEGLATDFHSCAARLRATSPAAIARGRRTHPAALVAFDLLRLEGEDLRGRPFFERRKLLEATGLNGPAWQVTAQTDDAATMTAVARLHGLEGVVAKRLDAPYRGGASHDWIKQRFAEVVDMVIGGVRLIRHGKIELLVGEETPTGLIYRGTVTARGRGTENLPALLAVLARPAHPFNTPVPAAHARGATWLDPTVPVEVSYTALTPAGRMRQGRLNRIRTDVI